LPGPRYRLAQHAITAGQTDKALSYLISEVKLAPEDPDILVSMASMFLYLCAEASEQPAADSPHFDYATHCLLRAVDTGVPIADAHYYLGVVSAMRGDLENAVEFFGHALDIHPEHVRGVA